MRKSKSNWLPAAVCAMVKGQSDHSRSFAEPDARAAHGPRNDLDAAARLRLYRRRLEDDSIALGVVGRGTSRLDGDRHAAGLLVRQTATSVQLFQADLRAGHQPRD